MDRALQDLDQRLRRLYQDGDLRSFWTGLKELTVDYSRHVINKEKSRIRADPQLGAYIHRVGRRLIQLNQVVIGKPQEFPSSNQV